MTISEIAKLAGVSASTVSKIINNKDQSINPETRKRVLEIVKEYHYTPYGMAKVNSQAKTFQIAVLLRASGKANQMVSGMIRKAQSRGYQVLLFDSGNDLQTELKHITTICKLNADGILWEPVDRKSADYARRLTEQNIQICYLNSSDYFDSYEIDYARLGYSLTEKLIDYRHTRIACLMKPENHRSKMVLEGYRKCLYDYQIPNDPELEIFVSSEDWYLRILSGEITGIVSSHFASALSFYEHLDRLHYRIPSDISLVSLKNDIRGVVSFPRISGIEIPYEAFGAFLSEQLINQCEKKETSESRIFLPEFSFNDSFSIEIPSSLRSKSIVSVGSINIDNTFNVDRLPQAGRATQILNAAVSLGGKGANQAIGAARLGKEVHLIGMIGNDLDAAFALDILNTEHISTAGISRDREHATGKAYIYIEPNGESSISVLSGANDRLTDDRIEKNAHLFKNAGYCLLSTEIPFSMVLYASRMAHENGVKNILKPAALKSLPQEIIPYIDLFIPNRKEAEMLSPDHLFLEEQADYFHSLGIPVVIITLGHEGCYLKTSDVSRFYPAADVTPVDTTGGADAFISALSAYLTEGYSLDASIQIATYAASFCVARHGVVPSLVDHSTLETFVSRIQPDLLKK